MTSVPTTRTATPVPGGVAPAAAPTFLGVLRGEFFKLSRQRLNWFMALGVTVVAFAPYLYATIAQNNPRTLAAMESPPQFFLLYLRGFTLALQRVILGIFLLIATARMVGLDYQQGTIRVLLARGVGRLQLLGAKLVAMALVGIALLAWGIALNVAGAALFVRAVAGNFGPVQALTPAYWAGTRDDVLTVLVSMGVSILLAAAITIVTRSLSFGLAGALGWFAVDNLIAGIILPTVYILTNNNDFWLKVSAYLLGPELNTMASVVVPKLTITGTVNGHIVTAATATPGLGTAPLVGYDATHTLVVVLVYAVIFAASAMFVTWRRDVLE